jgi:GR25 family glycosyltransferase involved in LPS biosynthesis
MKIFVLHYSKLVDRKAFIVEQFKKHAIVEYEFIEQYNKEDLKQEDVMIFDTSVNPSTMSLINKHIYAFMEVAAKYEYALILEDDVILSDNFMNTLTMYMTQLPNDFDMLFIGDGCNLHIEKDVIVANQYIYEKCLYPTKWGHTMHG